MAGQGRGEILFKYMDESTLYVAAYVRVRKCSFQRFLRALRVCLIR